MIVRKLEKKDVLKVANFEKEISIISFGKESINDLNFYIKKLTKLLDSLNDYMYIAEDNKKIIGWIWFSKKTNFITKELYLDFKSFYLVQSYHKTTVSELLMKKLFEIKKLEKVNKIIGRVEAGNIAMRFLYKKYDFSIKHIIMEYNG